MSSLHRLDVSKHLFYPSTAAGAAGATKNSNGGGGAGKKPRKDKPPPPPRIERLRRLPPPSMRFEHLPEGGTAMDDMFVLLSPKSSEGRILHASADGHALVYDADSRSASTMPGFGDQQRARPVFSVSVAGPEEEGSESLYVMRRRGYASTSGSFAVLDLSPRRPRKWHPLPLPPHITDDSCSVTSFAVLDGGRTSCVSCSYEGGGLNGLAERERVSTWCFDTASRRWRHAGDWALPFTGRAEHVPELGTCLGFSGRHPNHLCASDLSAAMAAHREPTLQHVWPDANVPGDEVESIVVNRRRFPSIVLERRKRWTPTKLDLVNLGSGRFCVAKAFIVKEHVALAFEQVSLAREPRLQVTSRPTREFAVLTGVEVLRGSDGGGGGLRLMQHRSKRYVFSEDSIEWVL